MKESKKVSVIYNDSQKVSRYDGTILEKNNEGILILTNQNKEVFIPKERIVRIESKKVGGITNGK